MDVVVMCTMAAVGTMFHADCRWRWTYQDWTPAPFQTHASMQGAVLGAINAVRSAPTDESRAIIIPDGVSLVKINDGAMLRTSDHTVHTCHTWAPTDYVARAMIVDTPSLVATSIADFPHPYFAGINNIPLGKRIVIVNYTTAEPTVGWAARTNTLWFYTAMGPTTSGMVVPLPLSAAPSTVIDPALVTLLANPGVGNDAPVVTTNEDLLALSGLYAVYRAIHANTPNPGPQMLNLATLDVDLDIHQHDAIVVDSIVTVGRILGWAAGIIATRSGWDGSVSLTGGTTIAHGSVRGALHGIGPVQTGFNIGWTGPGATPVATIRNGIAAVNPLDDPVVQGVCWFLATRTEV